MVQSVMVTWPGGVGCPSCASNQIPLSGGRRKTRKARKSRKAYRKGRKMTRRRR